MTVWIVFETCDVRWLTGWNPVLLLPCERQLIRVYVRAER